MAFPISPTEGQTHTENNTVWIYSAVTDQWNRSVINPLNETTYIGSDGAPGGIGGNTQVIFNDNGSLASDAGLVYNKTTDALTTGSLRATSLGTAAAPTFTFTGDPNTGIYSPGADQLAVATNGTGRLFINSTGLVGIGTSSPSTAIHIVGSARAGNSAYVPVAGTNWATTAAFIAQGSYGGGLSFVDGSAGFSVWTESAGSQLHYGYGNTGSALTRLFTLTNAGRVGIGTTSPVSRLHLEGDFFNLRAQTVDLVEAEAVRLVGANTARYHNISYQANVGSAFNYIKFSMHGGGDVLTLYRDSILFGILGTERARIDSSGRLLVGTSSVSGLAAAKTVVVETSAAAVQRLVGNTAAQGSAQKVTVVRYYPIVSLGTKLIIPFVSQVSINTVTLCKVTGLRNEFNSNSPLPFEINFAVGHTNALFNLSSYGGQGNFASIAINGLNVEITFTTAYTSGGISVCIEYMTSAPTLSIDVPNIAMN